MLTDTRNNRTTLMVVTALFAALTTIATTFFKIPIGTGYIHLGDTLVILAALMLPRKHAMFAAGFGAALADIFGGYAIWAPFSMLIKIACVFVLAAFLHQKHENARAKYIIAFILVGIIEVAGYYFAEGLIYGNWIAPMMGAPFNALQVFVGAVLALMIRKMISVR